MANSKLWDKVLDISQDYLGPAAERFLTRQITTHLGKRPEAITKNDLLGMMDWLKLSFALLTEDGQVVDEYTERLKAAAAGGKGRV